MAAETTAEATTPFDWRSAMTLEERKALLRVHPWRAWWTVCVNWGLVFAAMWLVTWAPNPLTILLALFVIGARQLGMAVLMHEAAHRTLFANRRLNDWVGNWLAAYPIWADVAPYRAYHLVHHTKTGTAEDPDLGLAAPFPITPSSFRRKLWRDLSGQTGWKQMWLVLYRDLGLAKKRTQRTGTGTAGWYALAPVVVSNVVLFALVSVLFHPAVYLLWVIAWLTTYRVVMRIRAIAEHGMVPDTSDPLRNTRTTIARWWERLFIAPNQVNYHLEHHLLMTVPHYNLPRMHRLLRERGVLEHGCVELGYPSVLRLAVSRAE